MNSQLWSQIFLAGAIALQLGAAVMAIMLIRVTGRLSAWLMISIALVLMTARRIIPFARSVLVDGSMPSDPVNDLLGLVLSGFMVAGIAMIGPIFERIFRSERELKESERRFRSYFELPLVGIAIATADGRWLTVNDRLCELLGFSRQEMAALTIGDLTFPEDSERERALSGSMMKGEADGYSLDKRFLRKSGEPLWTSQAVRYVSGSDGEANYIILIMQDISERKKAEESLRQSLGEKEVLLRELYHRTKNNMQMICSLLHFESSQFEDPKITEEFQVIENRIFSMSLVHEKLYSSRDLSNIVLTDYIQDLFLLLMQSYGVNGDRISFSIEGQEVRVPIDKAIPVGLILNELITNSLKHAFPDGRKGRIRVCIAQREDQKLELTIADNGIGVAPDFSFDSARGLGLKTVFALAQQLGGHAGFAVDSGVECRVSFRNAVM